jgi:hypothetical protein
MFYVNTGTLLDWERQMTDPTSRQRGSPIRIRQQISENNLRTESNIWSQVQEWDRYLDVMTDWPSVVMWLWLWLDWRSVSQSVSQYVLESGTPLGPMTIFYFFLSFARKLLCFSFWGALCKLSVNCSAIFQWSESRRTHNHTLLSHLRPLGSLSVASYDSQRLRRKYSYPPPHGEGFLCYRRTHR